MPETGRVIRPRGTRFTQSVHSSFKPDHLGLLLKSVFLYATSWHLTGLTSTRQFILPTKTSTKMHVKRVMETLI